MKTVMKMISLAFKKRMEYRFAFYTDILVQLFAYMVTYINIRILLSNYGDIAGWSFKEILLLWALNVFSYGISGFFVCGGAFSLEQYIVKGEFDLLLTKPFSCFFHLLLKNLSLEFLMHIVFSTIILITTFLSNSVHLNLKQILYLILLLISIVLIQSCIILLLAFTSFWIVKSNGFIDTAIYGLRNFTTYPIDIYPKLVRIVITFVIPYVFVSYIPASYLLGKTQTIFPEWIVFCPPIVAFVLVVLSIIVWKKGIRCYTSTGN